MSRRRSKVSKSPAREPFATRRSGGTGRRPGACVPRASTGTQQKEFAMRRRQLPMTILEGRGGDRQSGRPAARRWRPRARVVATLCGVALAATIAGLGVGQSAVSTTGAAVVGSGFTVTPGDLQFIL